MKYFEKMQIHSCFASASSSDVRLYKKLNNKDFEFYKTSKSIFNHNDAKIYGDNKIQIVFREDKTFYEKGLYTKPFTSFEKTPEFEKLVNCYVKEGYSKKCPKEINDYFKREEKSGYKKAKKAGFFLAEKPYEELTSNDFKGGFSDTIFNNKILSDYIGTGSSVFGYIGHCVRQIKIDKYLETSFFKKFFDIENSFDIFCTWLTSTDGRHFADSLEDCCFEEQKQKINNHLNEIFKLGFIYSKPEHKGTHESTCKIEEENIKYINNVINKVECI
jgi:hypothetical protein